MQVQGKSGGEGRTEVSSLALHMRHSRSRDFCPPLQVPLPFLPVVCSQFKRIDGEKRSYIFFVHCSLFFILCSSYFVLLQILVSVSVLSS